MSIDSPSEDGAPSIIIGDKLIAWILSVSAVATLAFFGWLAVAVLQVQSSVGHLTDQITHIRETRSDAVAIVVDRLNYLGERVTRLEDTVERLRHSDESRPPR